MVAQRARQLGQRTMDSFANDIEELMAGTSRKIAYVLGAGFSYGSNHVATVGRHQVHMPLQFSLFEELCRFHHKKIRRLDKVAKCIRQDFSPNTYRATRRR